MRSRAARSADGSVRFALSVPLVGNGGSELQHVALACDDIFAAARAMRDRGVPLLADPRQLLRRPRRPDGARRRTTIERMRELGVLYDAAGGGELLHFYTAMVGPEPVLRGGRAPRRLRRLRRRQLARAHARSSGLRGDLAGAARDQLRGQDDQLGRPAGACSRPNSSSAGAPAELVRVLAARR